MKKTVFLISVSMITACSTLEKHSLQAHQTAAGNQVVLGQMEPEKEHACIKVHEETHSWGMAGRANTIETRKDIDTRVIAQADRYQANYVHIQLPGTASILGLDINPFSDARAVYYQCGNVPLPG